MQQFIIIAAAHFLALLSPGPDFFLVARTSLSTSWRIASGACLGIAVANGVFIVAAFAGTAVLQPDRSEEHTSELQSLMRNSYAVFCLKKKNLYHRILLEGQF